jgi:mono/diheme cytochrome c family protein
MITVRRASAWLIGPALAASLLGCIGRRVPPSAVAPVASTVDPKFDTTSGPFAQGKRVFEDTGCFACHAIDGYRGRLGRMPRIRAASGAPSAAASDQPHGNTPSGSIPVGAGQVAQDSDENPPQVSASPGIAVPRPARPKGPRVRGPDLGKVGKDPKHTLDWLMAHIRNAKTHTPDSKMPMFERMLSAEEIRTVAEFLASLK